MIAFSIGSVHIYRYGIMYLIAFIFGYLGFKYIAKKRYIANISPRGQNILDKHLEDLMIFIFLGVLLGGRLGHVIIYNLQYYLAHPAEIIAFRDGWMSFIGWLFGVIIGILAFRKVKKWSKPSTVNSQFSIFNFQFDNLLVLFDILLLLLPVGIALGRLGNYLNQELYGVIVADWLPRLGYPLFSFFQSINIFHVYPAVDEFLRVNTNWLALLFEGLVTFVIWLFVFRQQIRRKLWRPWLWSAIFLMWYSFVRFFLEYVRADSQLEFYGPFTISQRFFVIFFILGGIILWRVLHKK